MPADRTELDAAQQAWERALETDDYGLRAGAADALMYQIARHAHSPNLPKEEWA